MEHFRLPGHSISDLRVVRLKTDLLDKLQQEAAELTHLIKSPRAWTRTICDSLQREGSKGS